MRARPVPGTSGPLHTDALGRLKVKFHGMDDGANCWLRTVQRDAGNGHGAQFLHRIGADDYPHTRNVMWGGGIAFPIHRAKHCPHRTRLLRCRRHVR